MSKFLLSLVLFAGVFSLYAEDPIKMTAADKSGHSSFTIWNVDGGGTDAPTSAHDYLDEKYVLRTPNSGSTFTFNGKSLQLGTTKSGDAAVFAICRNGNTTVSFANDGVKLVQGRVQPYSLVGRQYTFTGTCDVQAPATTPFEFWLSYGDNKNNTYALSAKLRGGEGTGLLVCERVADSSGSFILAPATGSDFAGTIKVGGKAASEPYAVKCELQGSPTMPCTLWATQYATITPQYAGGTQWKIGTLRLDAGSTWAVKLTNNSEANTTTLADGLTTAYPVNLTFTEGARPVNTGTGYIWDILTLPLEKKDQIHPEHFKLVTQEAAGLFPDAFPSVELRVNEKNDLAVLELVQRQVVQSKVADDYGYGYSKQNFEFPTSMTNKQAWSNSNLPMPTIDYIAAEHLNAAPPSLCTDGAYTFPGASLTVKNSKVFCEAAHEFTIPVLRLENKAQFWPLGEQYDDATAYVKGRIHVLPTEKLDDGPIIRVRRQSTVDIEAELTGTGCLQVQPNANDSTDSVIVFDHDNSAFPGKIRIQANTYTNYDFATGQTLVLKAANNVGGPLDAFTADALVIRRYSTLEVTNDLVFATANRGLTVENAQIKVGANATFTFANDITYAGSLVKVGAGRLVLGGTALGSKKTLTVEEGTLAVTTDTALDGVAVTFTGGALAVNPATAGDCGVKGSFSGSLPVAFDLPADEGVHRYSGVAVCTVPGSADVTPTAVRIPRHRVTFAWRNNADGTKTLLADISQAGLAIILR